MLELVRRDTTMVKHFCSKPARERILPNMEKWEKNEINAVNYLNDTFYPYAVFVREGGSDSTVSDIHVMSAQGNDFYVECKCKKAQSGQFVVKPNADNTGFITTSSDNSVTENILDNVNNDYATYVGMLDGASTNMKIDSLPQVMILDWIKEHYHNKNAKYVMIEDILIPLEDIDDYVTVSATMRPKRSGTSDPNQTQSKGLINYIPNNIVPEESIISLGRNGKKTIIETNHSINCDEFFEYDNYYYKFSLDKTSFNKYSLRRRSKTNNLNIIFSLSLNKDHPNGMTKENFESDLMSA